MVCLIFPNKGTKTLFKVTVDQFEVLQIEGLASYFQDSENEVLIAASNGVQSRPVIFKKSFGVAQLLNLIIEIDQGKIANLTWSNNCFVFNCDFENCYETNVLY